MALQRFDYVLIGGGVASVNAAIGIRELDETGSILIVGAEPHPPYDRPPLSKKMLTDPDLPLDEPESKFPHFYSTNRIEVICGTACSAIDVGANRVRLADGREVEYGRLLVATGARARKPDAPGSQRPGVQTFRSLDDMVQLRQRIVEGSPAIVVGAGYLGAELAAAIAQRGLKVRLVEQGPHPWAKFASSAVGAYLSRVLATNGVELAANQSIAEITAGGARLKGGLEIEGSTIVFATGVEPNSELAAAAGIKVDAVHGIVVDDHMATSAPNVWAAGDVAGIPIGEDGAPWHAEHHLHAKWEGFHAGKCMAGLDERFQEVPYFWTDLWDEHMIVRGIPTLGTPGNVIGTVESGEFCQLYADGAGRLVAGLAMSHVEPSLDGISTNLERLIRARAAASSVTADELGMPVDA